jgi:hypothetical protein
MQRDIKTVMESHARELMEAPGVVGVATGETDDGSPCILVLVLSSDVCREIPDMLEGYPVCILESGRIRPMD